MRLRIDLAYDGEPYAGFARQPGQTTVQGVLEDALSRVLRQRVELTCAGRTDRGVHATAQVVHVDVDPPEQRGRDALRDLDALRQRIGRMVGHAITIWRLTEVDGDFHARFSAEWRRYRYRLATRPADPRTRSMVWHLDGALDVAAMHAAAQHVVGEHDFASFCRSKQGRTTMRRILTADVDEVEGEVHAVLRGTAFCHQQVRSITGSLVDVGLGDRPVPWLADALDARDRDAAGPVAPPHGLTLEAVGYPDPWPDAGRHGRG